MEGGEDVSTPTSRLSPRQRNNPLLMNGYPSGIRPPSTKHINSTSFGRLTIVGNKVYENGGLKRILIDGGYIENNAYHFYLTDHLGDNLYDYSARYMDGIRFTSVDPLAEK